MNSPESVHRRFGVWLWRRPQRWFLLGIPAGALVALLVGVGLTASFVGGMKLMGTDAFCTSCHEMDAPHQELMQSSHFSNVFGIQASCGDCHVPPTLLAGVARHMQSYSEVWGHLTGELNTPAKFESHRLALAQKVWKELGSNDSAECRSCHTSSTMAFSKQPASAASSHQALAKGGSTCIDCHRGIAHTLPQGS